MSRATANIFDPDRPDQFDYSEWQAGWTVITDKLPKMPERLRTILRSEVLERVIEANIPQDDPQYFDLGCQALVMAHIAFGLDYVEAQIEKRPEAFLGALMRTLDEQEQWVEFDDIRIGYATCFLFHYAWSDYFAREEKGEFDSEDDEYEETECIRLLALCRRLAKEMTNSPAHQDTLVRYFHIGLFAAEMFDSPSSQKH